MDHPDFDRAELPEMANYLAVWLLGLRDWCPTCHGRGSIADVDTPNDPTKTAKCEKCGGRRWMGAIDLERMLVTLSHHRREISVSLTYNQNGYSIWSALDKGYMEEVQEADPLHAVYRLAGKVIIKLEKEGALSRNHPTDYIDH
ncbi:MAG: hypothetical protein VX724_02600 [Chloroflexota bacterium]|nr:hypothetical protein [Chloroflexota bacterium]